MKRLIFWLIVLALIRIFFIWLEYYSLYHPQKGITRTPADISIKFEEVNFKTSDHQTLNGWWIPAKDAHFTILYFHGNAGNIEHRLHKVKFFHKLGVNFFIFDYLGYGKSTGQPSEQGLYRDATAAMDYLLARPDVDKNKIIIYGKSLGAAVAIDLAARRPAAALISESGFASGVLRGEELFPFLPVKLLLTQRFDSLSKIKTIIIPKLIVHGRRDEVIAFHHGQMLFNAAPEPKKFLAIDSTHNDDAFIVSEEYKKILTDFISTIPGHNT